MQIIRGKIPCAKKVVVYGPEGIGKSTFASCFPDPLFIDTEGSTKDMDVARLPAASSWQMILEQIEYVRTHQDSCKTLVIDTIDWAERMCIEHICAKHHKTGIEEFGYGNGYTYVSEEFGRFLNRLTDLVDIGVHVVLTAHAQIRKFEQPDEMGAYDRYELKLGKKTTSQISPLVKEWAYMLLFANYKTYSIATDDKGKKHKAQGGSRVAYTTHHPCWDAKNRYGLPDEIPFEYDAIRHIIETFTPTAASTAEPVKEPVKEPEVAMPAESEPQTPPQTPPQPESPLSSAGEPKQMSITDIPAVDPPKPEEPFPEPDPRIPKALRDLMITNRVDEWDIQNVVAARGYFPSDMPIRDYPEDFVSGVLIGAWNNVFDMIKEMRSKEEIPFN